MFLQIDDVGQILSTITTSRKFADLYPGFIWVDAVTADYREHYVEGGQVSARPDPESTATLSAVSIPADGLTVTTLTDIPPGATVRISGPVEDEWVEESGSAEISVDVPGRYTVKVEKWPQKAVEVSFDAT